MNNEHEENSRISALFIRPFTACFYYGKFQQELRILAGRAIWMTKMLQNVLEIVC